MAASLFASPLYGALFPTGDVGRLFTDSAEVRAMLLVEGALARAQGAMGVIPVESAGAIHRASLEIAIDPGALGAATGQNGVPVPALVAAFRTAMEAPEHAQFVHWGATSQDIMDTGLMLRLRQALALCEQDIRAILTRLGTEAAAHAELPMPARTWAQNATPTTWGAVLATWGAPLADALEGLPDLRARSLMVSLSGAAGTASALGPQAPQLRAALAEGLGLTDPGRSWHTDRGAILRIAAWMAQITAALGGMGQTLTALAASGVGEISLQGAGASSTMPQKQNPVGPSALVALNTQMAGLMSTLQMSASHQHQRDGAAWFAEWLTLPQIVLGTASALAHAKALCDNITPQPIQMRSALEGNLGLVHAEALSFALAAQMPRPEAQAATKALCQEALSTQTPLADLALRTYDDLPETLFDSSAQLGHAPDAARAFAARVDELCA